LATATVESPPTKTAAGPPFFVSNGTELVFAPVSGLARTRLAAVVTATDDSLGTVGLLVDRAVGKKGAHVVQSKRRADGLERL